MNAKWYFYVNFGENLSCFYYILGTLLSMNPGGCIALFYDESGEL